MNADCRLKIVFMGTPAFAIPVLSALLDAGHEVVGVYTQPDRPTGRGKRVDPPQTKRYAEERGLSVLQPASLRRDEGVSREMASRSPDLIVVAAYGLFLPAAIIELPRLGALNVHPSLLPRYRGPSPVGSAILNGDTLTGVTIIQVDEGMDSGPIVAQREIPIAPDDTTEELTERLFRMGAALLVEALPRWERGEIEARPQDHSKATITSRLSREDGEIDWSRSAAYIARQLRAYHPWPGSFTRWRGRGLKVIEASALEGPAQPTASPGQVLSLSDGGVGIGTGHGVLGVRRLQLEGRRAISARDFILGQRDFVGSEVGA